MNSDSGLVEEVVCRLVEQVLKGEAVQMGEKGFDCSAQNSGQAAGGGNQAFVVFVHALDQLHGFQMADNVADIDFFGRAGEFQAAAFSADADEKPAFDQSGNDFHQVAF